MLKLAKERGEVKVVTDEIVSPTSTKSIAKMMDDFLQRDLQGTIHVSSEGSCSWNEFAKEIFEYTDTPVRLLDAKSSDFPSKVARPAYSVLDNKYIYSKGFHRMPHWRESLHTYLDELNQVKNESKEKESDLMV
jgi:dTDP-4-dehydrorhamnose reductase